MTVEEKVWTIAELINELKQHDPLLEVWCACECHGCADPLTKVKTEKIIGQSERDNLGRLRVLETKLALFLTADH